MKSDCRYCTYSTCYKVAHRYIERTIRLLYILNSLLYSTFWESELWYKFGITHLRSSRLTKLILSTAQLAISCAFSSDNVGSQAENLASGSLTSFLRKVVMT